MNSAAPILCIFPECTDGNTSHEAYTACKRCSVTNPKAVDQAEVQRILRQLEPHAPAWIAIVRAYIAQLEARKR